MLREDQRSRKDVIRVKYKEKTEKKEKKVENRTDLQDVKIIKKGTKIIKRKRGNERRVLGSESYI